MLARRLLLLAAAAALALCAAPAGAGAKTVWLCKPGLKADPCTPSLSTTRFSPSGTKLGTDKVKRAKDPGFDCFYVYPTVSDDKAPQADLSIDPEERSIALYQAARYSRDCRVFAPMYRQVSLQGLLNPSTVTLQMRATAYADVLVAWREYLASDNKGRGVVLISHSQGTRVVRQLVTDEIDPKPSVRKRLISAVLLGGNVMVKKGRDSGGDFKNIPACRAPTQLRCVVAFSTFDAAVPSDSRFGRSADASLEVLCTNPAKLAGGAGRADPIFPSTPFAGRTTIGGITTAVGYPIPKVSTAWISAPGSYKARCSLSGGANVLQISPLAGAPVLTAIPDATWGLHLIDANIALGNLAELVRRQGAAYIGETEKQ